MKNIKPAIIQSLIISTIFFITGLLCYKIIFSLFEPTIPGITFEIISNDRALKTSVLFAIVIGVIPLTTLFTWKLLSLSPVKRYVSILIIAGCISFAIFLRHEALKHYFRSIVTNLLASNHTSNFLYPIDPRNFVYFIIGGFITGCLISCVLAFGKKSKGRPGAKIGS